MIFFGWKTKVSSDIFVKLTINKDEFLTLKMFFFFPSFKRHCNPVKIFLRVEKKFFRNVGKKM